MIKTNKNTTVDTIRRVASKLLLKGRLSILTVKVARLNQKSKHPTVIRYIHHSTIQG